MLARHQSGRVLRPGCDPFLKHSAAVAFCSGSLGTARLFGARLAGKQAGHGSRRRLTFEEDCAYRFGDRHFDTMLTSQCQGCTCTANALGDMRGFLQNIVQGTTTTEFKTDTSVA